MKLYADGSEKWRPSGSSVERLKGEEILRKGDILLTGLRGEIVHPCPGTSPPYICCGYQVIDMVEGCPLDCGYCILKAYLKKEYTLVNTDVNAIIKKVKDIVSSRKPRITRFGTGELSDSLAYPVLKELNLKLIKEFQNIPYGVLELKSKYSAVDYLPDISSGRPNTVISWSLNADYPAEVLEKGAPPVEERLKAASKVWPKGYLTGFHFDPIVFYPEWREGYREVVRRIFEAVPPDRIAWISMGTLRYPAYAHGIYLNSCGEFIREEVRCEDGKLRYVRFLRTEMYRVVYEEIRRFSEDVFVYLCMESRVVWEDVFGRAPVSSSELDLWFHENFTRRFWR